MYKLEKIEERVENGKKVFVYKNPNRYIHWCPKNHFYECFGTLYKYIKNDALYILGKDNTFHYNFHEYRMKQTTNILSLDSDCKKIKFRYDADCNFVTNLNLENYIATTSSIADIRSKLLDDFKSILFAKIGNVFERCEYSHFYSAEHAIHVNYCDIRTVNKLKKGSGYRNRSSDEIWEKPAKTSLTNFNGVWNYFLKLRNF